MSDDLDQSAAYFGLGLFDRTVAWLGWRFGRPALDLVFKGDQDPYLMTSHIFVAGTSAPIDARWYRVGVRNRWRATIEDVQVTAERLMPSTLPGLPQVLHLMHDNPAPGTPHQGTFSVPSDRRPSRYVDVVSKVIGQPFFQLEHITPGVMKLFPAGTYELELQVRGLGTQSRRRTFVIDLDDSGELRFRARR